MIFKFIEFILLRVILFFLELLPFKSILYMTRIIGKLAYRFFSKRQELAKENIRFAFPKRSEKWINQTAYRSFIHTARLGGEILTLKRLYNKKFFAKWISFRPSQEEYTNILKKGGIFIMGHIGSWEWHGCTTSILIKEDVYTFAKRQSNPWLNQFIEKRRNSAGIQLIYTDMPVLKAFVLLRKNKVMTFISDQYAAGAGILIPFMNRLASTHSGPAIFARSTTSPVHFTSSYRNEKGQLVIEVETIDRPSEKEVKKSRLSWEEFFTRKWMAVLERKIREHPADYFWLHNRWKNPPKNSEEIWKKWKD